MDKFTQNENFSKIKNSEKFAILSHSFAVSKSELFACYRPFLGEVNIHKFDGTLVQVIENIHKSKISICFASKFLLIYSGTEGSITFYDEKKTLSDDGSQSSVCILHSHDNHFDLVGKVIKKRLECDQQYHYMCCHKKLLFFNNRLLVLFSENNYLGLIEC